MELALARVAVVTVSDRCANAGAEDVSGPALASRLRATGFAVESITVIPDGASSVKDELWRLADAGVDVVVTTGGTGVGPRDRTPEGTAPTLARELPGIAEEIRRRGALVTPTAVLSRGLAGLTASGTIIVNLAGSPGAATTGGEVLCDVLPHLLDQRDGGDHG